MPPSKLLFLSIKVHQSIIISHILILIYGIFFELFNYISPKELSLYTCVYIYLYICNNNLIEFKSFQSCLPSSYLVVPHVLMSSSSPQFRAGGMRVVLCPGGSPGAACLYIYRQAPLPAMSGSPIDLQTSSTVCRRPHGPDSILLFIQSHTTTRLYINIRNMILIFK